MLQYNEGSPPPMPGQCKCCSARSKCFLSLAWSLLIQVPIELVCIHDNPTRKSCRPYYDAQDKCVWPPAYEVVVEITGGPGGCQESLEIQQEANALHRAELKLTEQLVVASKRT